MMIEEGVKIEKVYLLHGFMGTAHSHFSHQVAKWKDSYELIPLDLPGHGNAKEDSSENYFEESLEWLISQLERQGEGYIVGLSLGASLAIHTALIIPELVKGVVLTGYSPFIPDAMKNVMEKQYEYFLNIQKNDEKVAQHFAYLHGERWKETLKNVLHTMTFNYPTVSNDELKNITVPLLILNGSQEFHEVDAVSIIKKTVHEAEVGLVPNSGHTANIDQPEVYNRMVEHFIEISRG